MRKTNLIQSGIVILAGVIFFVMAFLGIFTGKNAAVSNIVIQNSKQLALGFQYFKADQDRYPSEFEFANQDLMGIYFNVFPPANIPSSACPENFAYKSADSKDYNLNFCIPRSFGVYKTGWNNLASPVTIE